MNSAPNLETARLRLRAHCLDDFNDSVELWGDPEVIRFISGDPSTPAESWSRLLRYAGMWSLLGYGYWALEARQDGRFIGEAGFAEFKRNMTPAMSCPEAGWVLKSAEFGQGYATEALSRIHQWADDVARFKQTACIIQPDHAASINVARKLGYANDTEAQIQDSTVLMLSRTRASATQTAR